MSSSVAILEKETTHRLVARLIARTGLSGASFVYPHLGMFSC